MKLYNRFQTKTLVKSFLAMLLLVGFTPLIATAQFTSGNVVVLQAGDGSAALSSAGTALFLKEFNTVTPNQTVPTDSVSIPTTGAARLVNSGSASSEGIINLSADSTKIVVCGYDTSVGTASVNGTASSVVKRVIDTVSLYNSVGRAASTNSQYSANNIRSSIRGFNDDYYGAGGNSGTYYFGNTTTATGIQTTVANSRVVKIFNGNLYFGVGSGSSTLGIYKISGIPTTATAASLMITTGSSSSPFSFAINSSETVAYIADDRTSAAGGIQKWVYTSGSWGTVPADTFSVGSSQGARGLVVDFSGTYPVIYATTTDSRLIKMIDSGRSTASYITLATAPANTAFKSVAFSPKCVAPTLSATVTNPLCNGLSTAAILLSVSGGSTTSSIAWTGPSSYTASTQNISSLAAGTYNVTVQTAGGCSSTKSVIVTQPAVIADTLSTNAPICVGDTLKLHVKTGGGTGTLSLAWTGPSSFSSLSANPIVTGAAVVNSGKYRLTITDANSCTRVDSITATIDTALTINLGPDTSICSGKNLLIDTKASGNRYLWNTGDTTQKITVSTANKYFVTVTNAKGCKGADTLILSIDTLPRINLGADTSICSGKNLIIDTKFPGAKYLWNTGDTTQKITVSTANTYIATVTNGKGCKGIDTLVLAIDTLPRINLGADTSICSGKNLLIDTKAPGNKYLWNTGDTTQKITVSTANTYYAAVTNSKGCKGVDTLVLAIDTLPRINLGADTSICQLKTLTLDAQNLGAKYLWNTADTTKTINVGTANAYSVTVTNKKGCIGADTIVLAIDSLPVADSILVTALSGNKFNFAASNPKFATAYVWIYGDGGADTGASKTHTYGSTGTYTVHLVLINACGTDTLSKIVKATTTGIATISNSADIKVYPNPAQNMLTVENGTASVIERIAIYSVQGQCVYTASNSNNKANVDLSNLSTGLYTIQIQTETGIVNQKLEIIR